MGKIFNVIGYLILFFVVLSNFININLSDTSIIILAVLSAVFMIVGIFIKDKKS